MVARNLFFLFLLVVGETMGANDFWSAISYRTRNSGRLQLRQTETISYQCKASGLQGCMDCGSVPFCPSAGTTAYKIVCRSDEVCQITADGTGSCVIYNDPRVTDCRCTDAYVDDPYDATGNKYLQCLLGRPPILLSCPAGQVFDFSTDQCVSPAVLPQCSEGAGNFLVDCRQGYWCATMFAVPLMYKKCTSLQLFDPTVPGCVPTADVKIPDFTCDPTLDGAQADTLECNAFYVCIGGSMQGTNKNCCPTGQVFSETLMRCTTDATIDGCPKVHPCDTHTYKYVCSSTSPVTPAPTTITPTTSSSTTTTSTTTPTKAPTTTTTTTTTKTPIITTITTPTISSTACPTANQVQCANPVCSTDGAMAYPCNCKNYYWCVGGKATLNSCGTYLYFDSATKKCTTLAQFKSCC